MHSVSRRRVIAGSLATGGSLLVAGAARLPRAVADDATPVAEHISQGHRATQGLIPGPSPWESADLVEPEERRSVDGVLETELHALYTWKDTGGYQLSMRSYEGTIPGPTLRLKPGDALKINFRNQLPANRDEDPRDEDLPHHLNNTNFHFHGAHVSPEGISDNVFRVFEPGQSYDIEIDLPEDHPSGTYWYHPHNHGSADIQIASGMA
ncbi:MAG: multicopper oxidase domain-containing protein, partial [Chloroflexota bacterium]|nr:multicopper oxidase domain-containing protein [Chloroflexota bacterium]